MNKYRFFNQNLKLEEESAVLSQGTQTVVGIIFAVIVVTPNREDTIGSMQLLQIFHIRFHLIGSIVHQVAGKRASSPPLRHWLSPPPFSRSRHPSERYRDADP